MENILVIDTSTSKLILAVQYGGDRVVKATIPVEKSHGQMIMKQLEGLLNSADTKPSELNAIVVNVGPGSFTGLRIGLAAAKGMAIANETAIIPVNAFEVAAYRLRTAEKVVHVVVPLNRDECILCPIDAVADVIGEMKIVPYERFFEVVGNEAIAGIGLDLLEKFPSINNEDWSDRLDYDGADLVQIALEKGADGVVAEIESLEPLYLQKSIAEIRFEQRQKSS